MHEGDERPLRARPRLLVNKADASRIQLLQRIPDVGHAQRNVMDAWSALLDVFRDRGVAGGRLEELDRRLTNCDEVRSYPLGVHLLRRLDLEVERILVERQRLAEVLHGDTDVIEDGLHGRRVSPVDVTFWAATRRMMSAAAEYGSISREAMPSTMRWNSPAGSVSSTSCMNRCESRSRSRNSCRTRWREARASAECARTCVTTSSSSAIPVPVVASVFRIGGRHSPGWNACSDSMVDTDCARRSAPSRSALFTTKMSAISMMPALSACTSSPVPRTSTTIEMSAILTMSTSSWPTPTVSMITTSLPAASSTSATSLVARASPPRWPRVAMLRMKTPASP